MSYQRSPAPMEANTDDALYVAVLDVCEKSFFTFVETCESVRFATLVEKITTHRVTNVEDIDEKADPRVSGWLSASVAFEGTLSRGAIDVFLPERLARWLVASLLGISREVELREVDLTDNEVFDGIGEFANMVCGAWLTDLCGSQAFDLRPPVVARLPAGSTHTPDFNDNDPGLRLCVNNLPMRVAVRPSTD